MQNVSCPGCGAPVQFRSHASVLAVCEYCKTTILKDADSVRNLGKMSDVLEDYSPIQLGTSGEFLGQGFTVIGRIQLRYSAGMWNEWFVLFDDGKTAWLGDSSGLYTLTEEKSNGKNLPAFDAIVPARSYGIDGKNYIAAEVRSAECIGGQGELPLQVGKGWKAHVADFRCGSSFLTLDYSDVMSEPDLGASIPYTHGTPSDGKAVVPDKSSANEAKIYIGQAVTLGQLKCQLLRDDDLIKEGAGKFRGKIDRLDCPSCGSNVSYLPGLTTNLVCPGCHSQLDASSSTAEVLAAGDRMAQMQTTLALGAKATISGMRHELIGVIKCCDDENTTWTEYLLYNPRAGFLWLIETDEGWARAKVQDEWPNWPQGDTATLGTLTFRKLFGYTATVVFAAGAFNWRVSVGDKSNVVEFESGQNRLAAEVTSQEMTWSKSSPVAADQIRAWFGEQINADKSSPVESPKKLASKFIFWILAVNAIPLFLSFGSTWLTVSLAVAAIYYPAKILTSLNERDL
jgi:hypothetical protein